jgi:two-component system OmpR family sensor kinase/two-component system sensor histidine kinase QseC
VVQVAQPLAVRQLAALAALRSIVPVAVALPLVAAALWWLIGLSLAPLARVVQAAQAGGANALDALPTAGLPGEIHRWWTPSTACSAAVHGLRRAAQLRGRRRASCTPLTALKLQLGLLRDSAPAPSRTRPSTGCGRHRPRGAAGGAVAGAGPRRARRQPPPTTRWTWPRSPARPWPMCSPWPSGPACAGLTAPIRCRWRRPQALRGALRNLLDNAVKYGARQVQLSALRGPRRAPLLRVDDDGPGIPAGSASDVRPLPARRRHRRGGQRPGPGHRACRSAPAGREVRLTESPLGGLRAECAWPG